VSPRVSRILPTVEPILLTKGGDPFDDPAWLLEPKYDGYRGLSLGLRRELDHTLAEVPLAHDRGSGRRSSASCARRAASPRTRSPPRAPGCAPPSGGNHRGSGQAPRPAREPIATPCRTSAPGSPRVCRPACRPCGRTPSADASRGLPQRHRPRSSAGPKVEKGQPDATSPSEQVDLEAEPRADQ
jgi:hypothetical protein